MTDLQAAIGIEQLRKAGDIIAGRQQAAENYQRLLSDVDRLLPPGSPSGYTHSFQSFVCLYRGRQLIDEQKVDLDKVAVWNRERNRLMAALEADGVSVRQGTHAVHTLGYYRCKYGLQNEDCANAFAADRLSITLPLYCHMKPHEQEYVVESIRRHLK
jgi:dTDP-4-amino-4,6-dideoxygalactose transaminase